MGRVDKCQALQGLKLLKTNRNLDKEVFFGGKYPFYYNLLNILVPLYYFSRSLLYKDKLLICCCCVFI